MTINIGDTVILSDTTLKFLSIPIFRHERDAAYWAVRAEVMDGGWRGQQLWLVGKTATGPWETPSAGFI